MVTQYQKGVLVMDYLWGIEVDPLLILQAISDTNLETSYRLITENPEITEEEFLSKIKLREH